MRKIIFFIIIFFIAAMTPLADTQTLVKHRIDDSYTYYYDNTLERERYLYAQILTFGDTVAYCLELGQEIENNIYTYTTSFEEANIDEKTLEYIKLYTYYGYDYPGHNTEKYYMATQKMIWKKISGVDISWVTNLNPTEEIDIYEEERQIANLCNTHKWTPSFDNQEIEFTPGKDLVIEDTRKILHRFTTTSENVEIDGDNLIIKANFSGNEIIFTKRDYTGKNYLLYTSGLSQKMISTGTLDNVTGKIKVKVIGGSVEVTKLDKETNSTTPQGEGTLKGAIYELYDESGLIIDNIITGTKDKIENLSPGKYTLKEKTPSKGYLLDENIYSFEITKDNLNIKLNVYEEIIKRKVEIFKVLSSDTSGILTPESNISFEIYDNKQKLVDSITTDNEGHATITLPYGTYTFKQINTTENYYKVNDFTVTISDYDEKSIYKILSDSAITAKVKVIKKDFDTKENIFNSGIKFKIFDVKQDKYLSLKVSYPENKITDIFQIDKNGIFITPESLPPGDYILEEVDEPMNGYLYNNKKIAFTIGTSSNFIEEDGELLLEIPFYNQKAKGTINIIKYGEEFRYIDNTYYYKEILLEGIVFELYAREDIYENDTLIYRKDQFIKELKTDTEGQITENNLPLGKYYLKEINAPDGYVIEDKQYEIDLIYKDQYTSTISTTIEIKNYLKKGKLTINKYETGTAIPIENTLIEVCTKDNIVIYKGYTDKNGQIQIEDLPYGEYYISEVEASTGYRLLEDAIDFEIKEDETEINIYNERIKVPNTGLTLIPLDIFVILVTFLGIVLVIFFRKEKTTVFLSIIIILLGITYFIIIIYKYYDDYQNNQKSVNAYINNEIDNITEEKYQYHAILEIPSINLKRGILDINNEYNKAKYNIELVKEEVNMIVLAAHNGNYRNSYFGNLHNIELGELIKYYKDGNLYTYVLTDYYDVKKNGYADIYRKKDTPCIILVTCKDNTDDAQTIYLGYLKEITTY